MLRFFRKIRQKLLASGRLRSYLLYAIGEILLVMIGILLALQVNNWNEARKDNRIESAVLRDLHDEFVKNRDNFHRHLAFKQEVKQEWTDFLAIAGNPQLPDSVRAVDRPRLGSRIFITYNSALNAILSTGKLDKIKNDSLRFLLASWQDQVGNYLDLETLQNRFATEEFTQCERKLKTSSTLTGISGVINPFHSADAVAAMNLQALQDLEYQNLLLTNLHWLTLQIRSAAALKESFDQVITLLAEEMK